MIAPLALSNRMQNWGLQCEVNCRGAGPLNSFLDNMTRMLKLGIDGKMDQSSTPTV